MISDPSVRQAELSEGFLDALGMERSTLLQAGSNKADPVLDFARCVASGMECRNRQLDSRFLYDARGSWIYEQITRQPEYYLTRRETAILARHAREISDLTGPATLLEFGSGSSVKTDFLLSAYLRHDEPLFYVPIDVSESALGEAARNIAWRHPQVRVIGIHGTYEDAFPVFGVTSPILVIFLGSTVGNLSREKSMTFFYRLADHLDPGDHFLLGIDLVKERRVLEAAYNDAAGLSAEFTRNLFVRMNRDLHSGLDIEAIEHMARYSEEREAIEIHARFNSPQTLRLPLLQRSFAIADGEEIMTEVSRKFRVETLLPMLEITGFRSRRVFTDEDGWFALLLLERTARKKTSFN